MKQPALIATQVALLEALDDVTTARKLLEEAVAAQQSGQTAKAQPGSETVSAAAFLYQGLAKLQLKVIKAIQATAKLFLIVLKQTQDGETHPY